MNGWPGQIILRVNELAALWVRFTGKRDRLVTRLDEINGRFGKWTAVTASQGSSPEWKLRFEMRSPELTTRLVEVPTVRA